MNYLAHIFLSGEDREIQIGNFIGDAIKGKDYLNFPKQIRKGILLHRQIDAFTDTSDIVHRSKKRLHPRYGHYAGVIIDILYDHFLCVNWSMYSSQALDEFISDFYKFIQLKSNSLPEEIQRIIPYLIKQDWFTKYQSIAGMKRVLIGMENQIKHDSPLHRGVEDLELRFNDLNIDFNEFFPQLIQHVSNTLIILDKQNE
jgi:acyl carrier protein phosphodiesterase